MKDTRIIQLDVSMEFLKRLDELATVRMQDETPLTQDEWLKDSEEGRQLWRDIQYTNKYATQVRCNADLQNLLRTKYKEAIGERRGRRPLNAYRLDVLVEAFEMYESIHKLNDMSPGKRKSPSRDPRTRLQEMREEQKARVAAKQEAA